jgi:uncharacterized protein YfcZ (UPF0381/DUF406 family)
MKPIRWIILLAILAAVFAIIEVRADPDDCREAVDQFKSARSEVSDALQSYASCVSGSDGHEDCSSEFSTVNSTQSDFESAVSSYEGDCF